MTRDDAQRSPYGSPADAIDPSKALVPSTVQINEVRVKNGFWPKMRQVASKVPFARDALSVYYASRDPLTPWRTKGIMLGALAYFIMPADVLPDVIAGLGFTDDAAVLMMLMGVVGNAIKPAHKASADAALDKLRGDATG